MKLRRPPEWRSRFLHGRCHCSVRRILALCADDQLRPAARARNGRGAACGRVARRRSPPRAPARPSRHRRLSADLRCPGAARPRSRRVDIPSTYVPARNTIFLAMALGWAETARRARPLHRRQRARLLRLSGLPAGVHRRVRIARVGWRRARASRARGFTFTRRSSRCRRRTSSGGASRSASTTG